MKFALADRSNELIISSYARGKIVVGERILTSSLILLPDRLIDDWRPDGFEDLAPEDFAPVTALAPDLVLLGTGETQRFPEPDLLRLLVEMNLGFEAMTTPAACRTYNVLVSEGRRVAAALLLG
jgi:uncharacterized protein